MATAFARSGGRFAVRVGFAFGLATTAGFFALAFTASAFFAPAASALGLLFLAAAFARFGEDEPAPLDEAFLSFPRDDRESEPDGRTAAVDLPRDCDRLE
ncbi:MAG TPA: hypothetical protein VFC61_04680, partial [Blastocatellia bacterium]|nr:hypothetical protein [Blastocatellia bacterium]